MFPTAEYLGKGYPGNCPFPAPLPQSYWLQKLDTLISLGVSCPQNCSQHVAATATVAAADDE